MLSATRWSYFILHKSLFCKNSTKISMSSLIFVYGDHFKNKLRLVILLMILIQRHSKKVNFLFTLITPSDLAQKNDILCIVNRLRLQHGCHWMISRLQMTFKYSISEDKQAQKGLLSRNQGQKEFSQ